MALAAAAVLASGRLTQLLTTMANRIESIMPIAPASATGSIRSSRRVKTRLGGRSTVKTVLTPEADTGAAPS
jgi:hypothetical protein